MEALFLAASGVELLLLALQLHLYVLGIFAWLGLALVPRRYRIARAARGLHLERPGVAAVDLREGDSRAVFLAAREVVP